MLSFVKQKWSGGSKLLRHGRGCGKVKKGRIARWRWTEREEPV
ncbi:MAG: hypothetical protein ACKERG_00460 [Candidatus Hodgkinia cicadicola]